ncbi:MAG TPA: hypothetical protein EYN89_12880, partial [Flavobacteriales bacterium]|nr:hypothetical protein [Flavobacteriales bacterium]
FYRRVDTASSTEMNQRFKGIRAYKVKLPTLADEAVTDITTKAKGNDAQFGGIKVTTENGWFAARPSGTEPKNKVYIEKGTEPLGIETSNEKFEHLKIVKMQNHHRRKKRYVPGDYEKLLTCYLGSHENMTLGQYTLEPELNNRNILLIRHDVDHDFETALAMAKWESDRGIVATYCLLHTAWYWGELHDGQYSHYQDLVDFGNRLHALGHEISLHNNFVTLGLTDAINPKECLIRELRFMNSQGWKVVSTTLHGDKLCGKYNYNNAELFKEAVKPERGGAREIVGPNGTVSLGSISYDEVGVSYEAYDIARDIYITDSGGKLRCMKNAKGRRDFTRTDPSGGNIVGILTHPVWWDFGAF